jgi:hypothetical protein
MVLLGDATQTEVCFKAHEFPISCKSAMASLENKK